jgi:hypothetical protein
VKAQCKKELPVYPICESKEASIKKNIIKWLGTVFFFVFPIYYSCSDPNIMGLSRRVVIQIVSFKDDGLPFAQAIVNRMFLSTTWLAK